MTPKVVVLKSTVTKTHTKWDILQLNIKLWWTNSVMAN